MAKTRGTGLLMLWTDIDAEHEAAFNRWYDEEHLDRLLKVPGFLSAARYVALRGGPKYLAMYELEEVSVLRTSAFLDELRFPECGLSYLFWGGVEDLTDEEFVDTIESASFCFGAKIASGELDPSEEPLDTAKRELAEEIAKGARTWEHLTSFYTSPGFADEECHVYLATDLYDERAEADDTERIEIVAAPLAGLDEVIAGCRDSKTLVGLLWFRAYVRD